jgi:hypothetical protein
VYFTVRFPEDQLFHGVDASLGGSHDQGYEIRNAPDSLVGARVHDCFDREDFLEDAGLAKIVATIKKEGRSPLSELIPAITAMVSVAATYIRGDARRSRPRRYAGPVRTQPRGPQTSLTLSAFDAWNCPKGSEWHCRSGPCRKCCATYSGQCDKCKLKFHPVSPVERMPVNR